MSDNRKIAGDQDKVAGWSEKEINDLELKFLHQMFRCKDPEGVDTTVAYARFMSKVILDPDNYPIFMKLMEFENHWVVDALLGERDPEIYFKAVQPNTFIISECFRLFTKWKPKGIYPKSLLVLFGLLKVAYENPHEGYKVYPLNIPDVNNLGKHLDEATDQGNPVNRTILELLDRIATLNDPGSLPPPDSNASQVAIQANYIRGKFLDFTKHLNEAIPDNMLIPGDHAKDEVEPLFLK